MKPLFVKQLPPHVQVVSGQSLVTTCQTRSAGCRPCFVKRLPANMEVCRGNHVEVRCQDRVATEKNIGRMQQSLETDTDIRGSVWKGKGKGGGAREACVATNAGCRANQYRQLPATE